MRDGRLANLLMAGAPQAGTVSPFSHLVQHDRHMGPAALFELPAWLQARPAA